MEFIKKYKVLHIFTVILLFIVSLWFFLSSAKADDQIVIGNISFGISGSTAVVTGYTGADSTVYVPETIDANGKTYWVTEIGPAAFINNTSINKVVLPDSINKIGDRAFSGCSNLSNISRLNKREVYVFIGDSYGLGHMNGVDHPESSWISYAVQYLGWPEYYYQARGGIGFSAGSPVTAYGINSEDKSFYAMLNQTGAPSDSVTQVVIMGGYNDAHCSMQLNSLNIERTCNKAKALFPNATVSVGMCGASSNDQIISAIDVTADYYKQCTWYGCSYMTGIEDVMKNNLWGYISSDGVHPSVDGQNALGYAVASYLNNVLDMPASLKYIGSNAFSGCYSVSRIDYNSSNISVSDNAFSGCSITSYPVGSRQTVNGICCTFGNHYYYYTNDMIDPNVNGEILSGDSVFCFQNGYGYNGIIYSGYYNQYAVCRSGLVDTSYTGVSYVEGTGYVKFENGIIDQYFTGIYQTYDGYAYFENGYQATYCSGLYCIDGTWWLLDEGRVRSDYTGLAPNENGWWRIVNGQVDFTCNSVVANEYGWWYVRDGKIDFGYTGLAPNENGWWRIVNGCVDFGAYGFFSNEYGWWFVSGGRVAFEYTGIVFDGYDWRLVVNGQADFWSEGVYPNEYGWWYVRDGRIDFNYTGLAANEYGWWYIENGGVNFNYYGLATNVFGTWFIQNGQVQFDYTGPVNIYGYDYYVVSGKVL